MSAHHAGFDDLCAFDDYDGGYGEAIDLGRGLVAQRRTQIVLDGIPGYPLWLMDCSQPTALVLSTEMSDQQTIKFASELSVPLDFDVLGRAIDDRSLPEGALWEYARVEVNADGCSCALYYPESSVAKVYFEMLESSLEDLANSKVPTEASVLEAYRSDLLRRSLK